MERSAPESVEMIRTATGTGTASVSPIRALLRTISASATGTAAYVRSVARSLSESSTATAAMDATKSILVLLSAASTATASFVRSVGKRISVTGTVTATYLRIGSFYDTKHKVQTLVCRECGKAVQIKHHGKVNLCGSWDCKAKAQRKRNLKSEARKRLAKQKTA